jgi:hypothetical protein
METVVLFVRANDVIDDCEIRDADLETESNDRERRNMLE